MARPSKYSPEVRERAVRMVFDHTPEHPSQWAAIRSIAEKLGCRVESLRRWVRQAERDTGKRPGLTTSEREELKRLQRENFELKRANEILRKASAFFAQAELDRRAKCWSRSSITTARPTESSRFVRFCPSLRRRTSGARRNSRIRHGGRREPGVMRISDERFDACGMSTSRCTGPGRCGGSCGVKASASPAVRSSG